MAHSNVMEKWKNCNSGRVDMKHAVQQLIESIFGVIIFKDISLVSGCAGTQLPNITCTCLQVYTRLCILTVVPLCQCKYCEYGKIFRSVSHTVDAQKCIQIFMKSVRYFSTILTKTEMEQQLFLKFSNIKFYENRCAVLSLILG